ncbi:hypothetical protein PENSPDRAFT_757295 [Peniophora sp. CONT]|nr:hypothetical protein PENSPDRAFT_757295 [Peniophora sp. CONT]
MSSDQYTKDALASLASTVVDKAPYFGSLPLHADAFKIYFEDKNGQGHSVNTASATNEQLNILAEACSVAPFGRGAEAVVDDTYRKAGKLDLPYFAIPFEPATTPLVAGIKESVLEGKASKRPIRFELYKVNVYGEGGFFKGHKDTPRSATMFGREWTFDSAAAGTRDSSPAFGYAAFYSDVEHEVLPVTSGYRVTVTYNLYFDDVEDGTQPAPAFTSSDDITFSNHLQSLLDDPQFLPQGGYLGFGLRHSYPIQFTEHFSPVKEGLQYLLDVLKGADASVLRAARAAGLSTQLRVAYDTNMYVKYKARDITVLATEVMSGEYSDLDFWYHLKKYCNGAPLWPEGHKQYRVEREVHWVTPRKSGSRFKSVVLTYGNEPSFRCYYTDLCLLVAVGPSGERTAKEDLTKIKVKPEPSSDDDDLGSDEMASFSSGGRSDAYDSDDYEWPPLEDNWRTSLTQRRHASVEDSEEEDIYGDEEDEEENEGEDEDEDEDEKGGDSEEE